MDQAVISPPEIVLATLAADESNREARLRSLALPVLAAALTLVAYVATVRFAFVYDDRSQIIANPMLHSWRYFPLYFTSHIWQYGHPEIAPNYYRPLPQTWKLLHYTVFGLNPFWWHLSNIVVHLAVTLLVFALARRLTRDTFVAGASAIIFGLHPVHIEDVAWISGVTDPLLTLLLITSLLCYIDGQRQLRENRLKARLYLCISVLSYGLATLTKVTALVFPALIFFYEYSFGDSVEPPGERGWLIRCRSAIKRSVPYLITTCIYMAVRVEVLRGFAHRATPVSVRTIIFTAPSLFWFYLKSLIYPVRLSPFYDIPLVTGARGVNFALPLLGLGAAGFLVWRIAKDWRPAPFLALWLILPILPVLNISVFSKGDIAHDRFLYLPSVGFCILVACGLRRLKEWGPNLFGEPGLQMASVCIVACAFGVLTATQEQFWQDDLTLYSRGFLSAPMNTGAANNLALALVEKGVSQQALELLQQANARDPDHWISSYNLGFLYFRLGNDAEAEKYLRRALALNPSSSRANFFLGMVLLNSGRLNAAESSVARAIEIGPVQSGFYYGQGIVFEQEGKISQAFEAYKRELSLSPDQTEVVSRMAALENRVLTPPKQIDGGQSPAHTPQDLSPK